MELLAPHLEKNAHMARDCVVCTVVRVLAKLLWYSCCDQNVKFVATIFFCMVDDKPDKELPGIVGARGDTV